jgi:hypothetical protein
MIQNQQILNLGLDEQELIDIELEYTQQALNSYNDLYETNYTLDNLPAYLLAFLALNALMSINGWDNSYRDRFSPETIELLDGIYGEDYTKYKGIASTSASQLKGIENIDEIPDSFVESRALAVGAGLFVVYHVVNRVLAREDGRNFVGVITRRDNRVRPTHVPNDKRYWEVGTRKDFSQDFGCRCSYFYFATEEEAKQAGFNKI